jgi:hypothetical protein
MKDTKNMGLRMVNGKLTDKYGRTFEYFTNDQGKEDIRPVGVQRDIQAFRESSMKKGA